MGAAVQRVAVLSPRRPGPGPRLARLAPVPPLVAVLPLPGLPSIPALRRPRWCARPRRQILPRLPKTALIPSH